VRLVATRVATNLTGLSTEQLREWSSRRALIPADIQRRGRGSPAQYDWQALLLIRIAALLKERFHIELHAHRGLFGAMREALRGISFLRLWGRAIAIYGANNWELLDVSAVGAVVADAIIIRLDPHLAVLATEFAVPNPVPAGQLELFPARLVQDVSKEDGSRVDAVDIPSRQKRRRA
jgi:hypothetical protein